MPDLDQALAHLTAAIEALRMPTDVAQQALDAVRAAELSQPQPPLWAHIKIAAGGFWVSTSLDPMQTPFGMQVPDGNGQNFACANFGEVVAVLRERFGAG